MNFQKLELHISLVEKAIAKCRSKFKSKKKLEIYKNLILLFDKVKASNYKSYDEEALVRTKLALEIVYYGITHLNYSSSTEIPRHLIYCLNEVLDDWITDGVANYFIVISYNKSSHHFEIRAMDEATLELYNLWLEDKFSITHKQSLIQISKPQFLFDDFLGSVPVYHELGHFIDKNYQITQQLVRNPAFRAGGDRKMLANHLGEHFADIFAAQYIGKSSIEPLTYISRPGTISSFTHPSNSRRIEVVDAFLNNSGTAEAMAIVQDLKAGAIARSNGRELKIRNSALLPDPFEILKPIKISNRGQIHSLFSLGWENWINHNSPIRKKYPDALVCCTELNKLIKSSIDLSMPLIPFLENRIVDFPSAIFKRVQRLM